MLNEQEVLRILTKSGAVITGSHIIYTSGKHGAAYVNKDAIYPHTKEISLLCRTIAENFTKAEVDIVVAPAVGGVILSQWVAHHLSDLTGREVLAVYAEKLEGGDGFVIKRGYDKMIRQKRVLVVEDILTTGGSVKKVVESARSLGGEVVGIGALCNRGGLKASDLGEVPELFTLVSLKLDAWDEDFCPLCSQKVPINTDVGKGREFLAKKQQIG
ncbi:MAG: phosphoribosyltransferase family protein [Deltaproteobacteria bacterium]|nr:phosphoribosyltransferase family protein [Deltaproteobacteria bacterium]